MIAINNYLQKIIDRVDYVTTMHEGMEDANVLKILDRQQGSPKDIIALAISMLKRAKLDPRFVLIHSAEDGLFDPNFYSLQQFTAMGVFLVIDAKNYILFPYVKYVPTGYIPERYLGQKALAIAAKGKGNLIQLPDGDIYSNETNENYTLTLTETGKIQVQENSTITGQPAFNLRTGLDGLDDVRTEQFIKKNVIFLNGSVQLKKRTLTNLNQYDKPLKTSLEYEVDNLISRAGDQILFNVDELLTFTGGIKPAEMGQVRTNPIEVHLDQTNRREITLLFPESWTLKTQLAPQKIANAFGTFEFAFDLDKGKLTIRCERLLKKSSGPKEAYPELLAVLGQKDNPLPSSLVFQSPAPANP